MRGRCFSGGPTRIEPVSIGEVDVEPSVVVVVEEGQSAPFGLNDGALVVDTAPHIGDIQSGLLGHIHKLHGKRRGIRNRRFHQDWISPLPEWGCERVRQRTTQHK